MANRQTGHSDVTTEGIRVRVGARYQPEQSDPEAESWVYSYQVVITNEGDAPARLLSRHWIIRDADNNVREVRGPGVVGETPRLVPGETHTYVSGCPLSTRWGTMEGSYEMERDDGTRFTAEIGQFFLAETVAPLNEFLGDLN